MSIKALKREWLDAHLATLRAKGLKDAAIARRIGVSRAYFSEAIKAEAVSDALKAVCKLAGIRPITMHMARHTWAVMAKAATGDIHAVSRILGHSKTSTTERYLSRFDRDAVAYVFARLTAATPKGDG